MLHRTCSRWQCRLSSPIQSVFLALPRPVVRLPTTSSFAFARDTARGRRSHSSHHQSPSAAPAQPLQTPSPLPPTATAADDALTARDILHGAAGVAFFVAADAAAADWLRAAGSSCPSSIAIIGLLGVACVAHSRIGDAVYSALGPGVVWLRAALPLLLATPLIAPLVIELPPSLVADPSLSAPAVAAFCAAQMVGTMAAVGLVARAFGSSASADTSVTATSAILNSANTPATASVGSGSTPVTRTAAVAARLSRSLRAAAFALLLGGAFTASLAIYNSYHATDAQTTPSPSEPSEPSESPGSSSRFSAAAVRTPAHLALTTAAFVAAAALVPARVALFLPPTVCAGAGTAAALWTFGAASDAVALKSPGADEESNRNQIPITQSASKPLGGQDSHANESSIDFTGQPKSNNIDANTSGHDCGGGWAELRLYVAGAQRTAMALVQPAIATLALYTHTHRAALLGTLVRCRQLTIANISIIVHSHTHKIFRVE
jgi:hypothetical protein